MRWNWTAIPVLALSLAACVPGAAEYTKTEAPAALKVYGSQSAVDVSFVPRSARLADGQAARLAQLVHDGVITPADRVEVAAAGGGALAGARVAAVSRALLAYGVVATPRPLGGVPTNQAVLIVGRYAVMLPPCPDWSKTPHTDFTNEEASNLGCATAINLGMQASPADLGNGRTLGPGNGRTSVGAVDRYLTDQVIPPVVVNVGPITAASPSATPAPASAAAVP